MNIMFPKDNLSRLQQISETLASDTDVLDFTFANSRYDGFSIFFKKY